MAEVRTAGVPEDPAVLTGIAKVAIHHGHLDYALRMMVKSLSSQVTMDATEGVTTGRLIDRVRALARKRLGECSEMEKLRALLTRANCTSAETSFCMGFGSGRISRVHPRLEPTG